MSERRSGATVPSCAGTAAGLFVEKEDELDHEARAAKDDVSEVDPARTGATNVGPEHEVVTNASPWAIGMSHYDQRDLYTTSASTDDDGYGRGPSRHPEEGSYAYHREFRPGTIMLREGHANLYEREAWPWLNYSDSDPYFAHIYEQYADEDDQDDDDEPSWWRSRLGLGRTLKTSAAAIASWVAGFLRSRAREPEPPDHAPRTDAQLRWDVERALLREPELDDHDIAVDVIRGEVTLEGTVPDRRTKRAAGKIAGRVRGIRGVKNELEIREDDTTDGDMALASPYAFGS